MTDKRKEPSNHVIQEQSAWEMLYQGALKLNYFLREGLPIEPVMLNPMMKALSADTIAWDEVQKARARDDFAAIERALAHRETAEAIRTVALLLRRLERSSLRERSICAAKLPPQTPPGKVKGL